MYTYNTVGWLLITWFNDCVLDELGQIANPVIAKVDPCTNTRLFMFGIY